MDNDNRSHLAWSATPTRALLIPSKGIGVPYPIEVATTDATPTDYDVDFTIDAIGERLGVTRAEIRARPGGPPVTSTALHKIPLHAWMEHAIAAASIPLKVDETGAPALRSSSDDPPPARKPPTRAWRTPRKSGPGSITDEHLAEVAEVYRNAGRAPVEAVRKRFAVSRSTAGEWVMKARKRGLLGPAPGRGKAGEQS